MIATSYLATLLSFRRPQDCGYQRVAGAQIVYGSIVSGTSISRIDGFFKAPSHAVLQVGTVKARKRPILAARHHARNLAIPGALFYVFQLFSISGLGSRTLVVFLHNIFSSYLVYVFVKYTLLSLVYRYL